MISTPPPTIITVKASPLCKAVREIVAPLIFVVRDQDIGLGVSGDMLHGGNKMTVIHLENNIDRLAQLNIQTNQMLDKLVTLDLTDLGEKRDVAVFEQDLRGIAKLQNDALNQLSGTAYTNDLNALMSFGNPMAGQSQLRWHSSVTDAPAISMPFAPSMESRAYHNLQVLGRAIADREATVAPALQPLVDRCK